MVKFELPVPEGYPVSAPLASSASPVGNVPAVTAKVYEPDPPLAVITWLYALPEMPSGKVAGDTTTVADCAMAAPDIAMPSNDASRSRSQVAPKCSRGAGARAVVDGLRIASPQAANHHRINGFPGPRGPWAIPELT